MDESEAPSSQRFHPFIPLLDGQKVCQKLPFTPSANSMNDERVAMKAKRLRRNAFIHSYHYWMVKRYAKNLHFILINHNMRYVVDQDKM